MKKVFQLGNNVLQIANASILAVMAILVFTNVMLRYLFNSGIYWSEELARFLFMWLVFLGAIGALKDNQHLSVNIVVNSLSPALRKFLFVIGNLFILFVLWLVLGGSWKMVVINIGSKAPATGLPLWILYTIGILTSILMAIIVVIQIYRTLFNKNLTENLQSEPENTGIGEGGR